MPNPTVRVPLPEVGLCSACRHTLRQASARGQRFWRCRRSDTDAAFRRYPPLPVQECAGFESGEGGASLDERPPGPGRSDP